MFESPQSDSALDSAVKSVPSALHRRYGHEKLIEADHTRLCGQLVCDRLKRVLLIGVFLQLLMHGCFEAMKVAALFALERNSGRRIHEIGFARDRRAP